MEFFRNLDDTYLSKNYMTSPETNILGLDLDLDLAFCILTSLPGAVS